MEKLIRMTQMDEPLGMNSLDGIESMLNEDEYTRIFPHGSGPKLVGFKCEASRESDVSFDFRSAIHRVVGNYYGALQVMAAEFQLPTPLVPTRRSYYVSTKMSKKASWDCTQCNHLLLASGSTEEGFDFLRDENTRNEWDILSNGGVVQEMAHIINGWDTGNYVSPTRINSANSSQSNMLISQESCTDQTTSFIIYAPVDIVAMKVVLNGGDPDYVALLPSGLLFFLTEPQHRE
ncbi:HOMEOBOX-LEUCINE ZIPPER PROTEIN MERISTEM L1 [Salix koriyanagi]|uniref:HOMEOBOX-LEUCINE ZIPPER PROTEIN MERISTEM L1 n=1 Tax=Salix koriyanagi TaxID=2511006 RepID=A0A9Q0T4J1_9ROSI|nr:HOMEOBOX-LEUCINE ZIPPER PROTEIN MERISTEM L1 [Salix koriyanagi]